MPPKGNAPSKKTEKKLQEKVIEDKTFGLKNKNKSKVVQNYVKSVAAQVKKVDGKGGEAKRLADEFAQKAAQKKEEEKKALLASLFKSVKKTQEVVEEEEEPEVVEEKYEEIDLYTDQREQIWRSKGEDAVQDEGLATWHANKDKTDKICKFFLDAVEANKYGWRWICPNGVTCIYRHALPQGYVLKRDLLAPGEERSDLLLEEQLENERHLIQQGTPVTFERFVKWKEEKKIAREKEEEKKRLEEAKKTGGKGLNVLSGRALFTYDPTLFTDDAEALDNEEYEEEEEEEKEDDGIREEGEEDEEGEEPEGKEWGTEKIPAGNEENVKINEDVFLGEDDVELPDDDS
jgi:hypothetical protein